MTLQDLLKEYDDGYMKGMSGGSGAGRNAGVKRVVEALRDEFLGLNFPVDDNIAKIEKCINDILGGAGDQEQASGSGPASVHTLEQRPDPQVGEGAPREVGHRADPHTTSPADPSHGSPELDEDARKLEAMGQDAGPTFAADPSPQCEWEGGNWDWVSDCGAIQENPPLTPHCPSCGRTIKFVEGKT